MCLWAIYIFPRSICLFCCRKYVVRSWKYINRPQTHECGNCDWGRAISRKGIDKWDFRCSVCIWKPQVWELSRLWPETSTKWYRSWIRLLYNILWRADGPLNEVWESYCRLLSALSVRIFVTFFLVPPFFPSSFFLLTLNHESKYPRWRKYRSRRLYINVHRKGWGRAE